MDKPRVMLPAALTCLLIVVPPSPPATRTATPEAIGCHPLLLAPR